jgi:hypothetical protein
VAGHHWYAHFQPYPRPMSDPSSLTCSPAIVIGNILATTALVLSSLAGAYYHGM